MFVTADTIGAETAVDFPSTCTLLIAAFLAINGTSVR